MSSLLFFFLTTNSLAESEEEAFSKIIARKDLIKSASEKFNINSMYLSAVIYTERTKNFDWTDEAFDEVIARVGQNSSLGFAQVKIKTAYFIERQLTDSTSQFYCGKEYEDYLTLSSSPFQIIKKLKNDSLNILYAAAYLRIIQSLWSSEGFPIDDNPEIIGSLYQLGLFKPDGSIRDPHFFPRPNDFGLMTKNSILLFDKIQSSEDIYKGNYNFYIN